MQAPLNQEHTGPQIVLATFEDQGRAGTAMEALRARGIPEGDVSVAVRHDNPEVSAEEMAELDAEADATGTDVALGGVAGGLAGFVAGLALFSIPGLGPFLGIGVLAGTLSGTALGSAIGGHIGQLNKLGIPPETAERYGTALEAGHVVLAVTASDATVAATAQEVLTINGAESIDVHPYVLGTDNAVLPDPADQAL
jgi:hypothetical protein